MNEEVLELLEKQGKILNKMHTIIQGVLKTQKTQEHALKCILRTLDLNIEMQLGE